MAQITLTLDLTHETVDALRVLVDALNKTGSATPDHEQMSLNDVIPQNPPAKPEKPAEKNKSAKSGKTATEKTEKPTEEETEKSASTEDKKGDTSSISKTDVRAEALKFSKAGKQAQLKKIFAKYNAEKLSDIAESDYPALMADLEAANE